jgi:hypothetical protein
MSCLHHGRYLVEPEVVLVDLEAPWQYYQPLHVVEPTHKRESQRERERERERECVCVCVCVCMGVC